MNYQEVKKFKGMYGDDVKVLVTGQVVTLDGSSLTLAAPVEFYAVGLYEGRQVFYTNMEGNFCRLLPTAATVFTAVEGKWLIGQYVTLATREDALIYKVTDGAFDEALLDWRYTLTNYGRTGDIEIKNVKASQVEWKAP